MESNINLAKAIISVMQEVKGIEKKSIIGTGDNQYKGISDRDVKKIIGDAMAKNGLCILPLEINSKLKIDRWDEEDTYSKSTPKAKKSKQSVFTEVEPKYLLLHVSGESQVITGYGHGIDSQDKGAGKATTYALKYTLLYLFLVPTGEIDDTDRDHSDTKDVPKKEDENDPYLIKIIEEAQRFTEQQPLIEWANSQIDWRNNAIFVNEVKKLISKFK